MDKRELLCNDGSTFANVAFLLNAVGKDKCPCAILCKAFLLGRITGVEFVIGLQFCKIDLSSDFR